MRRILLTAIILFIITPFVFAQTNAKIENYTVPELIKNMSNKRGGEIYENGYIKILYVKRDSSRLMLTVKALGNKKSPGA